MLAEWILGTVLIGASIGVIAAKKPVYSCLFFLLTLLTLAAFYLQQSAEFIASLQILVYAGAILVIFMFVIVLFQDAYQNIDLYPRQVPLPFLITAGLALSLSFVWFAKKLQGFETHVPKVPENFGSVESLGRYLYLEGFFPFESVILLFLIAIVGSLYIGKKVN